MAITTATAILIGAGLATAGAVGSSVYQASEEKKSQKKILQAAEDKAAATEAAAKKAKSDAAQAAKDTLTAKRRAATQTILTSPLGVDDESGTNTRSSVLGGV